MNEDLRRKSDLLSERIEKRRENVKKAMSLLRDDAKVVYDELIKTREHVDAHAVMMTSHLRIMLDLQIIDESILFHKIVIVRLRNEENVSINDNDHVTSDLRDESHVQMLLSEMNQSVEQLRDDHEMSFHASQISERCEMLRVKNVLQKVHKELNVHHINNENLSQRDENKSSDDFKNLSDDLFFVLHDDEY